MASVQDMLSRGMSSKEIYAKRTGTSEDDVDIKVDPRKGYYIINGFNTESRKLASALEAAIIDYNMDGLIVDELSKGYTQDLTEETDEEDREW